jgi:glucose-6-phosphate 1-dehydrogenase
MPAPLTIVIFGASGDLTSRKLIPALFRLFVKDRLPPETEIVGVARSAFTDDSFRDKIRESAKSMGLKELAGPKWEDFARKLHYVSGDAQAEGGLLRLQDWLARHEGDQPTAARRLYYLAVAPTLYPGIVTGLGRAGMNRSPDGWMRIIIEKPFGRDLASARALNQAVHAHFDEEQIYRIDHYLGKETVQNLLVFRFANAIFEPIWNHQFIDCVQITVAETVKVEGRGDYYDRAGVLRDMFQSHILQVLTLVAMEAPARFAATPVRNEKVKVLEAVSIPTPQTAASQLVCGQYAGYRNESGVNPHSRTPTYAAVRLAIDNWRWRRVPFYLRSGKGLARRYSEIIIQFKSVPHLMFALPPEAVQRNRLSLTIQPNEGIHLCFESKVPDEGMALRPADMAFLFHNLYREDAIPEAYERLLQDAINGDATLFMRSDEIEWAWQITDPLIAASDDPQGPIPAQYPVGSAGPTSADEFIAQSGHSWICLCE